MSCFSSCRARRRSRTQTLNRGTLQVSGRCYSSLIHKRLRADAVIIEAGNDETKSVGKNGNTPLMSYLKQTTPDPEVVEAFLRCNADFYMSNKEGEFPLDYVMSSNTIPGNVRNIFTRYVPGIWEAVSRDDAMSVRRLINEWCRVDVQMVGDPSFLPVFCMVQSINEWCRVDVQMGGKTLLQLSLEAGTESIIRVVSGIRPSMEFAHSVLAGDSQMVRRMLRLKLKININFRNLGDRGKTPIFYALLQGNAELVQTLLDRGARVDISIKGDAESDIPLFFAALEHQPAICPTLLKAVIPVAPVRVDSLFYKGRNVLFHCIEKCVGEDIVDFLLAKSSAYLVTQLVERNLCPREMALQAGCLWMVRAIDAAVVRWVFEEEGLNRQILVLQGYQYIPAALKSLDGCEDEKEDNFYRYLSLYHEQVDALHTAVEECDEETVRHIIYFRHPDDHSLDPCLADSRRPGDGQPLLHKAVLRGSTGVTQLLAETLVYQRKQRLDSIRDQYFRTALHYAYGMEEGKELVDLLLDYGASEFTMDKDCRSPLAFKDRQGQPLMGELLQYQYLQDFSQQEPDPWSEPLPIPILGYLLNASSSASSSIPAPATCPHGQPYLDFHNSSNSSSGNQSNGHGHHNQHHRLSAIISPGSANSSINTPKLTVTDSNLATTVHHHGFRSNSIAPLGKAHKLKSVSDTKLHRLPPDSGNSQNHQQPPWHGLASHLANFPDVVKSRLSKRPHGKNSVDVVMHKDYLPLPMDAPRDSEDDYDYEDDVGDSRDLLDEKELRKSTSCSIQ
ncbi:ankyrin repeat containing protein [Plakobranchus ocellatus]|uniref:Ankyrin repeat containing protein n=1 Tax=Plakobranchus ocellatus TaxID=259542 RepID=A0AAV4DFF8_9GAST|nr:ankyrin repeat containing protein [Plakobranchus ocellatus]